MLIKSSWVHPAKWEDNSCVLRVEHKDSSLAAEFTKELVRRWDAYSLLLKAVKQALEIFDGEWPDDDEIMGPVMEEYQALINKAEGR